MVVRSNRTRPTNKTKRINQLDFTVNWFFYAYQKAFHILSTFLLFLIQ